MVRSSNFLPLTPRKSAQPAGFFVSPLHFPLDSSRLYLFYLSRPANAVSRACTITLNFVYNTCKLRRRSYVFPSLLAKVPSSAVPITLIAGVVVMLSGISSHTIFILNIKPFDLIYQLVSFSSTAQLHKFPNFRIIGLNSLLGRDCNEYCDLIITMYEYVVML